MDKFLSKHHSKFTWMTNWIYDLVLINFYAILATGVGLGVLGLFPAWMTAHQLIKRRLNQEEFSLFKTFVQTYKNYFWKANALGYIFVVLGSIIALSWFYYLSDLSTTLHWIGLIGVGFIAVLVVLMIGITPISFVYFTKFKTLEHLKFTLIMTMGMPKLALIIFLNSLFFYGVVMIRFISIFPFLAFTLPALVNLLFARKKLLKLFTIFKDDHIMIRTLNSYANHDDLWILWEADELHFNLDHERFEIAIKDENQINRRSSLVLTNEKEEALGMLLTRVYENKVYIELLYIDVNHRRRGYAKRMLNWLELEAQKAEISEIIMGDPSSLYHALPPTLNQSLSFFRKYGYQMTVTTQGYQLKKTIGRKTI